MPVTPSPAVSEPGDGAADAAPDDVYGHLDTDAALDPLDVLPDGAVVADAEGRVVSLNAAARALLGVTAEDAVGRSLAEVVALQNHEGCEWFVENDPYGGLSTRSGLTEQSWFTATDEEVLVTARLVRPGRGRPVSAVAVSLRSARGRERLDRERSDLVATVAHELRSPLTGVKGFVSTLLNRWERLNDQQKLLMLQTVHSDAERLSRLITELLDVARIDTNRLSLYPRDIEVPEALERIVATLRAGTGRPIELEVDDDVPSIFFDPDKLVQVVNNLVENAVRHGEGTVRVWAVTADGDDDSGVGRGVALHVDDEGEGIDPSIRARVFTKFWRHGVRGGSGLGMYIVHGLLVAHGGTVGIGESPAGGARITLRFSHEDARPR